ncbi:MAG TPA: hypothetical protein VIY90_24050 [Steroidobacteraceae bacterium]
MPGDGVNVGKWLLLAAVVGVGVYLWHAHGRAVSQRDLAASADSNGFVPVATPGTVLILAALNCPLAPARRAAAMAQQLTQLGIPNRRTNSYSATITSRDQMPLLARTNAVLTGEIPIVIVDGMARANPTVDEVAAEYRRDR